MTKNKQYRRYSPKFKKAALMIAINARRQSFLIVMEDYIRRPRWCRRRWSSRIFGHPTFLVQIESDKTTV